LKLIATPNSGMTPLAVTFNSIVTGGTVPYIVNYNFGDGTSYQGQTLIHTFYTSGTFNVTVTVTDSNGNVQEAWTIIHVSTPPTRSQFTSFTNYVSGLLIGVVEGIVEVAVVVLPIALVVSVVILPFRNRFRAKKDVKAE
jgi:PKD repeat protein